MYKCVSSSLYTLVCTVQTNMYSMGLSDRFHKKNESSFHMSVGQVIFFSSSSKSIFSSTALL